MRENSAAAAILGAAELFLGRREALGRFDFSVEGFWRSFGAAIYALPLFAFVIVGDWAILTRSPDAPSLSQLLAARLIDYGFDFLAMTVLLGLLAKRLAITRQYGAYIVVRNWSTPVILAPQAVIALLLRLDLLSMDSADLVSLLVLGVTLFYQYRIARWTLGWNAGNAAAFVAADTVLSLVLVTLVNGLFGL